MPEGAKRIGEQIDIEAGNLAKALADAKKTNMAASKHWQEQVWYGQLLNIVGRKAKQDHRVKDAETDETEAETAFRRAVELAPDQTETWLTLVQFLVATDQAGKAREVLNEATVKLPPKQAPRRLARKGTNTLTNPVRPS